MDLLSLRKTLKFHPMFIWVLVNLIHNYTHFMCLNLGVLIDVGTRDET